VYPIIYIGKSGQKSRSWGINLSIKKNKSRSPEISSLRIIGGRWRSRKISFTKAPGLRPTGERIRETLFNWLAPRINGANCLDLYAGSGILCLEALSRGAEQCTALDNNHSTTQKLQANSDLLNAGLTIINTNCTDFLTNQKTDIQFDVVFIDPPFAKDLHSQSCSLLEHNGWLKEDALIYCELPSNDVSFVAPANWQLQKDKIAGGVRYMLYTRFEPTA